MNERATYKINYFLQLADPHCHEEEVVIYIVAYNFEQVLDFLKEERRDIGTEIVSIEKIGPVLQVLEEPKIKENYDVASRVFLGKLPIVDIVSINCSSGLKSFCLEIMSIDEYGELCCSFIDKRLSYKTAVSVAKKHAAKVRGLFFSPPKRYLKYWK